jgi:hypothetical protein
MVAVPSASMWLPSSSASVLVLLVAVESIGSFAALSDCIVRL